MSRTFIPRFLAGGLSALFLAWIPACTSASGPGSGTVEESYWHIRPSWSPDGALIAFTVTLQDSPGIYLVDSSGTNVHRLVEGEGIGTTWSPDSRWLAFSRAGNLYMVKADGDSLTQLSTLYGCLRPAWSPDGRRLAYLLNRLDISGIWLYDLAANSTSQLVGFGNYPSWNPQTGELVVLDAQLSVGGSAIVYSFLAVDINTLSVRTLGSFGSGSECAFVSVSPDGNTILYGLKPPDGLAQVWKYESAGSRFVRLTDDGGDNPAWSPDGTRIVYTRTVKGDGGLWMMNVDGSDKRRLTKPLVVEKGDSESRRRRDQRCAVLQTSMLPTIESKPEARTASLLLLCVLVLCGCHRSRTLQESVSEQIRDRILSAKAQGVIAVRDDATYASDVLAALYRDRGCRAFWSAGQDLLPQADSLVEAIKEADRGGLRPEDYHLVSLDAMMRELRQHQQDREFSLVSRLADLDLLHRVEGERRDD